MAARVGSLNVALDLDAGGFFGGLRKADAQSKATANSIQNNFGGAFKGMRAGIAGFVSALSIGTIISGTKAMLDYAGSLGETAQQLGVSTRELQTFRYAAQQNGATVEEADTALGKFAVSMSKALSGSKSAAAAFDAVGVELTDLQNKSKSEIIGQIADQMVKTGGAAANAAPGVAVFGRGFLKLAPLLDQGSKGLNALAAAAEGLGIVLDQKLIDQADEAADKVDQVNTVLKAQIAGQVAENSGAIIEFANSLVFLVSKIGEAIRAWTDFENALNAQAFDIASRNPFLSGEKRAEGGRLAARARGKISDNGVGWGVGGSSVTVALGRGGSADVEARRRGLKLKTDMPRPDLSQYLAGGGGGGRRGGGKDRSAEEAERKRLDAMRDANQFDQEIRQANIEILRAKQQLATDEIERYQISIDIKDAERAAYASQLEYEVAAKERSRAEADMLLLKYDEKDAVERQILVAEESARAREASARVDMAWLENQRDMLESQLQNATTVKQRRDIQRKILDLEYRMERAALNAVLADEQASDAAKEIARQRLAILGKLQAQDNANNESSGDPLADYIKENSDPAAQFAQAQKDALYELEDGLTAVLMGTKSVKEAFHDMAMSIVEDLIRIIIKQMIVKALTAAMGGGFSGGGEVGAVGMASGGFVSGPGGPREDRIPAMLSNGEFVVNAKSTRKFLPLLKGINDGEFARMATGGLALPRANMGERVKLSNDNEGSGRRGTTNLFDLRGAVMTEDILRRINEMGAQAADQGGNLGVKRMRDLNERTFGRASR